MLDYTVVFSGKTDRTVEHVFLDRDPKPGDLIDVEGQTVTVREFHPGGPAEELNEIRGVVVVDD